MQRISDVQKKLYETTRQLSVLSSTDVLTGIDNRLQFNKILKQQVSFSNRYNSKFAMLLLDLDHFKEVNDHLGHHTGDLLLKEVANRLRSCLRESDFIARLGGDEFAIIITQIRHEREADYVAQKILDVLQPSYHLAEHHLHVSCSIGIACFPTSSTSPDLLVQRADIAMYYAKELGRNNYQNYTEVFQAKHNQRFFLENSLRFASENNELFMCYQPIFNLKTRQLVGMEALMRWKHPKFGLIAPDVFIPIAEDIGLIKGIGKWALLNVCQQAKKWYEEGFTNIKLAVNISSQQLLQPDLVASIVKTLDSTLFSPKLLEFELTESTVMSLSNTVESTIKELSDMGIRISLDDFGTGYSSLSHLKRLPITTLKIDKSFVMDIFKDPNNALIVKSIIALGKTFKLNVIAEGIETEEQLQFLVKHNCQEGQGYFLSLPLSTDDMTTLLKETKSLKKSINSAIKESGDE